MSLRTSRRSRASSPLSIMNTTSAAFSSAMAWTVRCCGSPDPMPTTEIVLMYCSAFRSPRGALEAPRLAHVLAGGGRAAVAARRVQVAVVERGRSEHPPDDDDGRPAYPPAADPLGQLAQPAPQDLLVWPAGPGHDGRRALGAVAG